MVALGPAGLSSPPESSSRAAIAPAPIAMPATARRTGRRERRVPEGSPGGAGGSGARGGTGKASARLRRASPRSAARGASPRRRPRPRRGGGSGRHGALEGRRLEACRGERGAAEVARRLEAVGRILCQRPSTTSSSAAGMPGTSSPGRGGGSLRCAHSVASSPSRAERRVAREHEGEHAAERVDVGAGVDALAADLLRRDVAERPDPAAGARRRGRRVEPLGEPEVRQVDVLAAADEDVLGLDVAVDDPARVRGVERAARAARRCVRRARASSAPVRAQRASAGPAPRRGASRCTASRRARPRSGSGSRAGRRSPRRRATRARSGRGTPGPRRAPGRSA